MDPPIDVDDSYDLADAMVFPPPGVVRAPSVVEREDSTDVKTSMKTVTTPTPTPTLTPTDTTHTTPTLAIGSPTETHPVPMSTSNATFSSSPAETPQVLVVDDDPLTRTLMKRMLTRMGCMVTTAENGYIALEILTGSPKSSDTVLLEPSVPPDKERHFTVVFMDNQMPVMSGLKAIQRLREVGRRDFVVGVTGNALLADQNEYLEAGADV
ncbi:hypothetical protein H0H81_006551 [Sphagnurus paluster]|uniref:Response regulatory domain-containing protein n=1 Tax=Sphagnurus paluster TaxID=117069 RepID=A0A9P7GQJ2_9AGAR|nr:hypothetical protein H0H81_006551 [Sphagnurus paluster]